ncbi:MAG: DegV family protein [Dehalococcoidia bacterium]|nr:DegV family protein [Dehalococcoidia bacterium]
MQGNKRVSIVTDSAASLPAQLADESDEYLHVIPHQVVINGTTYREGLDLSPEEFYETLRRLKRPPATSGPSPEQFARAFEAASTVSDSVVCLVLSSKFSMTYDSAVLGAHEASEVLPGTHIEVIDTESATGSGLMVIEALRLSEQGRSADEIVRRTKELVPRVKVIATLDTLYYLQKGGRVPVLAHLGTSLLQVKPIFEMYRGEVRTIAKVRTAKRAKGKLVDLLHENVGEGRLHAAVLQGNVPEEAQELEERIASEFNCIELYVGTFSPVIGAHTGPGLLGVSYWSESETA